MPDNRRAGALRERVHCQFAPPLDDGWGNPLPGVGDFATQFTISAAMTPRTGGEGVDAARLGGSQPFVVTVRNTSQTRQITTAWRLLDARNDKRVFAITSPPADPDGKNQWLEFLAVEGRQ
ncbi:Phage head-tail joining protein [Devosia crocina]|uniref:Phage head-tail joining protein n=1 Tax=Devosia crocina TaxID=429728 RepID=A0A1I7NF12_9HYPH|nr:head-tail adaptor protein [Devosia crocina]SFV33183.1 Phage head-tail joining protein [Devosia crocina]